MRDEGAMTLREARDTSADAAFLYALFVAEKADEMARMPIDAAAKDYLLRMQYMSMNATYRREYPAARFDIVELEGEPIGQIVTHRRLLRHLRRHRPAAVGAGSRAGNRIDAPYAGGAAPAGPAGPGQCACHEYRLAEAV